MNCRAFHSHTLPSSPEKFFLNHRSNTAFDQQAFRLIREQIPEKYAVNQLSHFPVATEEQQQH